MKKILITGIFKILVVVIFVLPASAQNETDVKNNLLQLIKKHYGTSDVLVNGKALLVENPRINKHPNLFYENWISATIYIKGELFYGQPVMYNLYTDELILQFIDQIGIPRSVVLDNLLVDSLNINGHMLISMNLMDSIDIDRNFVEVINAGELNYCIGYYKDYIRMYSTMNPYGKYSDLKKNKYLVLDNELYRVNRRRHFLRLFPENKKDIRRYLRKQDIRYKKATISQIETLMQYCNELD